MDPGTEFSRPEQLRSFLIECISVRPPPPLREPTVLPKIRRWAAQTPTTQPSIRWRHPKFIFFSDGPVREPPRSRKAPAYGRRSYAHSDKNGFSMLCLNKWQGEYFEDLEADPQVANFLVNPAAIRLKSDRLFKPDFYVRRGGEDWLVDCVREDEADKNTPKFEQLALEVMTFGIGYEVVTDAILSFPTRAKNVRTIRRARFDGTANEVAFQKIGSLVRAGAATIDDVLSAASDLRECDILNAIALRHVAVDLNTPMAQWRLRAHREAER